MRSKAFVKRAGMVAMSVMVAAAMAVPAFAADSVSQTIPATGSYEDGGSEPAVVLAPSIAWKNAQSGGGLEFVYTASSSNQEWDSASLSYKTVTGGSSAWAPASDGTDTIQLMNRSNAQVKFSIGAKNKKAGIDMALKVKSDADSDLTFESAVGKTADEVSAARKTVYVVPTGTLNPGDQDVHLFDVVVSCQAV